MSDKAIEVVSEAFREQGATFPRAGARLVLAALKAAGIAVMELPESHPINVVSIDMAPERDGEHVDPELVISFNDIPKPGRLFDRRELAAALLAAADAAEETQ